MKTQKGRAKSNHNGKLFFKVLNSPWGIPLAFGFFFLSFACFLFALFLYRLDSQSNSAELVQPARTKFPVQPTGETTVVITELPTQPTNDAVVVIDEGTENEAPEETFSLSAAEIANSGTHIYIAECVSASGSMDDCKCEIMAAGKGQLSLEFSDGKIEFGGNFEDYPAHEKIANNTYQFVDSESNQISTLIFTEDGFDRNIEAHDDTGDCAIAISFLLTTEPPTTPTPSWKPVAISKSGFGQDGRSVGFAFIIENPNPDLAFEGSSYELSMLDENGVVVGIESDHIDLLLPGQSLGIGGVLQLSEDVAVSAMDVQLVEGNHKPATRLSPFQVESVTYHPGDYYSRSVTGIVNNPTWEDFIDLHICAIVYDDAGNIVGGGDTHLSFLMGKSSSGAVVPVVSTGDSTHAELYPALSSLIYRAVELPPDDASEIRLTKYGFGQDGSVAGYGMLVENPNSNYAIVGSQYHVTAFSSDDSVLATDEGDINLLLPEQELGVGGYLRLGESMDIEYVVVQIRAGQYRETEPLPQFTFENVSYQPDEYQVIGDVIIPYTPDTADDLRIYAIAYDEHGQIIGGGNSYDIIGMSPTNERATVGVYVEVAGVPATVELFASIMIRSIFE
jgi:hypothetical protein